MARALASARTGDRERTAARLLKSSAGKFYDPEVDIDWDAAVAEDKQYQIEHRISLYGTPLWQRMTESQRRELGKHEAASIASNGIWFELLLMQMLLKEIYDDNPTQPHVQYALTEIADECRHSTMFAKSISRIGAPAYGPRRRVRTLGKLCPVIARGPARYAAILVAEEVLDRMQRETMADENIQPLIRMVNRIHVLEEARHVSYAREAVVRGMAQAGPVRRAVYRLTTALVSYCIVTELINPRVYASVGLDPAEARRQARANPHFRATIAHWGERVMGFLDEVGLVAGPGRLLWRASFLLER